MPDQKCKDTVTTEVYRNQDLSPKEYAQIKFERRMQNLRRKERMNGIR